jgi:hypothetical protein
MPVGSKWQIVIPSELGYGPRGAGAKIGPNSVLIFELELLEILKQDDAKKPGPPHGPAGAAARRPRRPTKKPE